MVEQGIRAIILTTQRLCFRPHAEAYEIKAKVTVCGWFQSPLATTITHTYALQHASDPNTYLRSHIFMCMSSDEVNIHLPSW